MRADRARTSRQVDEYCLNRSCWGLAWVASAVAAAYSASARSSPSFRRPPKSGAAPSLPSVGRPSYSATSSRLRAAVSNPCRRLSRACPLCWNPGTGPQTSKPSPSDGRRCHFVLLLDHTLRSVLLFFSRHLRVTNLGCTLPIAKLALSSEGIRVPTPAAEECMLLDVSSLGAVGSVHFAADIHLSAGAPRRRYGQPTSLAI
jgi:hypothetical protein